MSKSYSQLRNSFKDEENKNMTPRGERELWGYASNKNAEQTNAEPLLPLLKTECRFANAATVRATTFVFVAPRCNIANAARVIFPSSK